MEQQYAVYCGHMESRIGTGWWGVLYDDEVVGLKEHRVSSLTRPQEIECYGDKDVLHEQLRVREEWDQTSIPTDIQFEFYLTRRQYWHGCYGDRIWSGSNGFFVYYGLDIADSDPDGHGGYYPAGALRTIFEATRLIDDDRGLVCQVLRPNYTEMRKASAWIYEPTGEMLINAETTLNPKFYSVSEEYIYYFKSTQTWRSGLNVVPVHNAKRIPVIPYYWQDWMWEHHPPVPVTDYEAYSECYRNAITNVTMSGMNNIANVMEVADVVHDIKRGNIAGLFESLQNFLNEKNIKKGIKLSQDAWLKYRYLYGTTKADAEAAVDYFLDEKWKSLTDRQVVRGQIGLSDGEMRLKMRLRESADLSLQIRTDLQSVGLFPSLYTLWDLVPYSFVVDWFVPSFSEELEDLQESYYSAAYDVKELLVTRKREWVIRYAGFDYHAKSYSRTFDMEPPQFEFYEEHSSPKGTTVVKRIIDGFALFVK